MVTEIIPTITSIILTLSIVIGGIWALYKFGRRDEKASLLVKINAIELINLNNDDHYLNIEIIVSNNGSREVHLYYDYKTDKNPDDYYHEPGKHYRSVLKIYKVHPDGNQISEIDSKTGLTSAQKKYTGRLRAGVDIRMPYLIKISTPGLYFIEFIIDINMMSYFRSHDYNDKPIKSWSDRKYFSLTAKDLDSTKTSSKIIVS